MQKTRAFLLSFLLALSACSPVVTHPSPPGELIPVNVENLDLPYQIGVGDRLELKFFFVPDMDSEAQVRPDGRISVMFIGDVKAAGLTAEQLAKKLRKKLRRHLKQSDLVVSVKNFGSQRVYVGGEVVHPGPVQLQGRNSLIQVLGEAGWITPLASNEELVIVRRNAEGREQVYHVDSGKIISGEDTGQDVMVLPGDVILVPPLHSVELDRWVDRNMRQVLPFGASANYNYTNYYDGSVRR